MPEYLNIFCRYLHRCLSTAVYKIWRMMILNARGISADIYVNIWETVKREIGVI